MSTPESQDELAMPSPADRPAPAEQSGPPPAAEGGGS
jgi:hypothetical protein